MKSPLNIRLIKPSDDPVIANIIRTVMPEFGAVGPGYAINDPEVDTMWSAYHSARARYYVVEFEDRVEGGGGIAPLRGGDADICEIQKMYFMPALRGKGAGEKLMDLLLEEAKDIGFARVYLETMDGMTAARRLYEKKGFVQLDEPLGATGHGGCDIWYLKSLRD